LISNSTIDFSIVVPVYNNNETIKELINDLNSIYAKLKCSIEVIFVIDGSPDNSVEVIKENTGIFLFSHTIIELSRNYGSFSAIKCGIENSNGRVVAVKTADLQEPVDLVIDFYNVINDKKIDIVFGTRKSRSDGIISNTLSKLFWKIYKKYINKEIPISGSDVFACTNRVVKEIKNLNESNSSLLGLLYWVGFKKDYVEYERKPRLKGKSSWNFGRKINYALDSIFSFTNLPVIAIQIIGVLGIAISLIASMVILILKLSGLILVPGYTALMLVVLFSNSSLLFAIGLVGNYSWRAFENTKNRPSVIIMDKY
jgi:glycosyltransferase involved in cell wall biosynthesis